MQCPKCKHPNPAQAKFCMECGTKIGEKFAPETESQKADSPIEPAHAEHQPPEAERRQLTVMFCDLVDSTPLSEQLDPEVLREVIHDYQSVCAKVIRRFEGHIARYFGDGILVYFGYPQAHEDDPHRAVRTGLGIVEAMKGLNARPDFIGRKLPSPLQVRIAIHTGVVVAGDIDQNERLESMAIIGETPNIAARLQALAEPDTLVISADTYQRVEGLFDCRVLGEHSLRGISRPMTVYQVLAQSMAKSRFDVAEIRGLTPLVGRELEAAQLLERWKRIQEGEGQVVLLNGEAGIGKSRLVSVLKAHVTEDPQAWLTECRCSPYHTNSAFYPVIDSFERMVL